MVFKVQVFDILSPSGCWTCTIASANTSEALGRMTAKTDILWISSDRQHCEQKSIAAMGMHLNKTRHFGVFRHLIAFTYLCTNMTLKISA